MRYSTDQSIASVAERTVLGERSTLTLDDLISSIHNPVS